jgi:hypothetical protein
MIPVMPDGEAPDIIIGKPARYLFANDDIAAIWLIVQQIERAVDRIRSVNTTRSMPRAWPPGHVCRRE